VLCPFVSELYNGPFGGAFISPYEYDDEVDEVDDVGWWYLKTAFRGRDSSLIDVLYRGELVNL
jgi:hypothetical protein